MGRIFKLVFNLLLFECHNHILIWDNNKAKRHFEERTHYRAGGIGKEIALHLLKRMDVATMIHLDHGKDLGRWENISCYLLDVTSTEIALAKKKNN
jgi:hypothetical protein